MTVERVLLGIPAATSGVYRIRVISTGRAYIGSSVNMRYRCRAHLCSLRAGRHGCPELQAAWETSAGADIVFEVEEQVAKEALTERETALILSYGDRAFNIVKKATPGPRNPKTTWTEERRRKHSERMQGNTNAKGIAYTPE